MQLDINRKIIIQKNFDLVKEKHIFLKIKITYKINNVWYVFSAFIGDNLVCANKWGMLNYGIFLRSHQCHSFFHLLLLLNLEFKSTF